MPGARQGLITSMTGAIAGFVIQIMFNSLVTEGLLIPSASIAFELFGILAIFLLILVMPYWETFYLIGWWIGLGIMFQAGIVGLLEFAVYSIVLAFLPVKRLFRRAARYF
jgi:hypothetical protein